MEEGEDDDDDDRDKERVAAEPRRAPTWKRYQDKRTEKQGSKDTVTAEEGLCLKTGPMEVKNAHRWNEEGGAAFALVPLHFAQACAALAQWHISTNGGELPPVPLSPATDCSRVACQFLPRISAFSDHRHP